MEILREFIRLLLQAIFHEMKLSDLCWCIVIMITFLVICLFADAKQLYTVFSLKHLNFAYAELLWHWDSAFLLLFIYFGFSLLGLVPFQLAFIVPCVIFSCLLECIWESPRLLKNIWVGLSATSLFWCLLCIFLVGTDPLPLTRL